MGIYISMVGERSIDKRAIESRYEMKCTIIHSSRMADRHTTLNQPCDNYLTISTIHPYGLAIIAYT